MLVALSLGKPRICQATRQEERHKQTFYELKNSKERGERGLQALIRGVVKFTSKKSVLVTAREHQACSEVKSLSR